MTASSTTTSDRTAERQTSQSFPAATTVVTGAVGGGYGLLAGLWVSLDVPGVFVGAASSAVLAGGLGFALARSEAASVRLGATSYRYLLVSVCVPLFAGALVGWRQGRTPVVACGVLSGAGALFGGWVLARMARTRYVRAVCGATEPEASWEATLPPRAKRRRYALGIVVLLVGVAGLVVGYLLEVTVPVAVVGGAGGAIIGTAHQTVTLDAHAVGLEIERPLSRQLLRWAAFDSYELTDEELRLRRVLRPDIRCAREEIADIDAVLEVLDRHLDES